MGKRALITGITGQDGAYLAKLLLDKGYEVFGAFRRLSTPNFWRLQALGIYDKINFYSADLGDSSSIIEVIKINDLEEIYNLAAQSFVGTSFEQPISTSEITGIGVTRILEAIRHVNPKIKFYQASTSELYGNGHCVSLNEDSTFQPSSPYAAAKLYAYWVTKIYREGYKFFACNGILFNHESPLRGLEFVTRKLSNAVAKIALGLDKEVFVGNLDVQRDWGYAPDYVTSMWLMLQQNEPGDYVVATNEAHSVKEYAEKAFNIVGLDWQKYVKVDPKFMRPLDVSYLRGDFSKAKKEFGWKPTVNFDELVKIMVKADLNRWKRWQKGESFPWDASCYPDESKIISRYQSLDR